MSDTTTLQTLPSCDICGEQAAYDFQTNLGGRWAYGCVECYLTLRAHDTLGTGRGQRLVLA